MSESTEFEKGHSKKAVAAKLRRLAEALENDQPFDIQVWPEDSSPGRRRDRVRVRARRG